MKRFSPIWALVAVACLLAAFWQANPLVDQARAVNQKIAVAASATYVSLRLINAALSTAQEVEISASVAVGASAQPLKILEPVDDTVERAADVVFVIAVVTGLMSVGLGPVASIGLLLVGVAAGTRALGLKDRTGNRALALGLMVSLALPGAFWLGGTLAGALSVEARDAANATLAEVTGTAQGLVGGTEQVADTDQGWFSGVRELGEAVSNYTGAVGYFLNNADRLFGALLTLMGIFLLETLVMPVVLFALAWGLLRR